MDEKDLQEIEGKLERALYLYSPIPITTIKEIVDQLIAEVRQLKKPLIVSSTIKKLKEKAEKEYIRGVKDTQCELIPKINYEKEQKNIWCDSWDKEVGQNQHYKQALVEIAQSTIFTTHATEREKFLIEIFVKLIEIAKKALEGDTNE